MESAHANTEASVSGHFLDSSDKSMKCVSKKREFFEVGKKVCRWIFFADLEVDLEF